MFAIELQGIYGVNDQFFYVLVYSNNQLIYSNYYLIDQLVSFYVQTSKHRNSFFLHG